MSLIDIQKKVSQREFEYYKNLDKHLEEIKKRAKEILPDAKIYLFGSVVEGRYIPGKSDIDVLIVSKKMPRTASEQAKIRVEILKDVGFFSPFEIHLADEEVFEYYKKNVKKLVEIN